MHITTGRPATLAPTGMVACPHSLAAAEQVMSLPMSPDLSDADFEHVVAALADAVGPRTR